MTQTMSVFSGGSAYNMVASIADGYIIATELTFKQFKPQDFTEFPLRGRPAPARGPGRPGAPRRRQEATQKRQRRLQRLQQAIVIANASARTASSEALVR